MDVAVIGKVRCVGGRARSALCHPYNRQPKEIVQPQERWDQGIKVALALFDTYVVLLHSHTQQPAPIEDAKGRLRSRNCILIGENTHRRYLRVSVDHPPDLSPPTTATTVFPFLLRSHFKYDRHIYIFTLLPDGYMPS